VVVRTQELTVLRTSGSGSGFAVVNCFRSTVFAEDFHDERGVVVKSGHFADLTDGVRHEATTPAAVAKQKSVGGLRLTEERGTNHARVVETQVIVKIVRR